MRAGAVRETVCAEQFSAAPRNANHVPKRSSWRRRVAGQSIVRGFRDAGYAVQEIDIEDRGVTVGDYKQLDLRDGDGLNDAFAGACGVVHFGSHPGDGHLSTSAAWDNFMTAGFNVFQAARNCGIRRVAWASSIEV